MARHLVVFGYSGSIDTFTIPANYAGGFAFDLRGGQGRNGLGGGGQGGLGSQVTGTAEPGIGDVLSFVVGTYGAVFGATGPGPGPAAASPGAGKGGKGGANGGGNDGGDGGSATGMWRLPVGAPTAQLLVMAAGGGGGGGGEIGFGNPGGAGGYGGIAPSPGQDGINLQDGSNHGYGGAPANSGSGGGVGGAGGTFGGNSGTNGGAGAQGGLGGAGGSAKNPFDDDGGGGGGGGAGYFAGGGGGGGGDLGAGAGGGGGISAAPGAATAVFNDNAVAGQGLASISYLTLPVAAITGPSGTVTTTSSPTVQFTYTSAESAPMQSYRIVVFAEPATGWPAGLDGTGNYVGSVFPLTALYDSGIVYAATPPTGPLPFAIPNGDLRVYVQVVDQAGADTQSSAWVFSEWTQNVAGPNSPAVACVADAPNARVSFTVNPAAGLSTAFVTVQRSTDNGTTWKTIAGGANIPLAGTTTIYDYWAPREITVQYQITPFHTTSDTVNLIGAPWTGSTYIFSDSKTWVMCSADPSLNTAQDYQGPNLSGTRHTDQTVYYPENVENAIVFQGTMHAEAFIPGMGSNSVTFLFNNDAEYANFLAIATTQKPVLLKTLYGDANGLEQFWVVLGADLATMRQGGAFREGSGPNGRGPQIRTVLVNLYVVAEPV